MQKDRLFFKDYLQELPKTDPGNEDFDFIEKNPLCMADKNAYEKAAKYLDELKEKKDSSGGVIKCVISNVPPGLGDPVFDKLDARLAYAIMSIGAVKGFEIGDGFLAAKSTGSKNNDPFYRDKDGRIRTKTNHSGGILGGISTGEDIVLRVGVKPTPSIGTNQQTVDKHGNETSITIHGRHDPVIAPRACVVVESMAAITLVDFYVRSLS